MSSINPYFTFQYSQPEEYHFSHDSVFLARWLFEKFQSEDLSNFSALDLCAGSGVVGLDLLFHLLQNRRMTFQRMDFLEVQEIYKEHFLKNIQNLPSHNIHLQWISGNYHRWQSENLYDLIVCNPPYFRLGQGKLSPSDFKNRCRFYIDASFFDLLSFIQIHLRPQGQAFVLLKDLSDHGWNPLLEAQKYCGDKLDISVVTQIRGTDVVCFKKT